MRDKQQEIITCKKVIIGCTKFVFNMENRFYSNKRFKPRDASQGELTRLSVLWSSLSQTNAMNGFRSFPHVSSNLCNVDVEKPSMAVVNRALKPLVNVNYYDKKHQDS